MLRFTVDTATSDAEQGASLPPIATDAKIDVELNSTAVVHFRRIAPEDEVEAEELLLKNTSVTGLYELQLKPGITAKTKVATVRLQYRSVEDGKRKTRTHVLYASDFAKQWNAASRRHRLASLGAAVGETLKGQTSGTDVARKAEELATQKPEDTKARELANTATAAAKLAPAL
jgi:hypothetical protein